MQALKIIVICVIVIGIGVLMIWFERRKKSASYYKYLVKALRGEEDLPKEKEDSRDEYGLNEAVCDPEDKRCKILGYYSLNSGEWHDRVPAEYGEKYYRLHSFDGEIDEENTYLPPLKIVDHGIGGGEKYELSGSNKSTTIWGERLPMKVRLIYGDKTVTGRMGFFPTDERGSIIGINLFTDDRYKLCCSIEGCSIILYDEAAEKTEEEE